MEGAPIIPDLTVAERISPATLERLIQAGQILRKAERPVRVLAERMRAVLQRHFAEAAPKVEVVDHLSSNALAGPRYIRLRRGASFSDRDLAQLVQHEAFVHIGTSLNGAAQTAFPILGAGHAGTTRTQEGLAVFAEIISGAMDPSRLLRLADRVLAIKIAMEGADFLELFRYFCER